MQPGARAWSWRPFACVLVLGALGAMLRLPCFATIVVAQMMAAVGQTPEWSRAAAYGRPAPSLSRAVAAAPADAELQLGALSWEISAAEHAAAAEPAWCGNSYRHDTFQARGLGYRNLEARSPQPGVNDVKQELARVLALGRRFPDDPSIRAFELRRLLLGPIWIPREEAPISADRPRPPLQLLEELDAVARAGQRLEPRNGFFEAMRAVAFFAGEHDEDGLHFLHAAAAKPSWNDHTVDETRAVWNLLRTAYGDRGVEQLLPSEEEARLPQFAAVRAAARVAVRQAAALAAGGDDARAEQIRGDVLRLGVLLQDQSPQTLGKEVGDALFYLGMAPATPKTVAPRSPRSESERRQRRERYAADLEAHGSPAEAAWVRTEGEQVDAIHRRVRSALDAVYACSPYWPPRGLAVWWEFDVILVQQLGVILALWGGVVLLSPWVDREKPGTVFPAEGAGPGAVADVVLFFAPVVTSIGLRGGDTSFWPESITAGATMIGMLGIARWAGGLRQRRWPSGHPSHGETGSPCVFALIGLISTVLPIGLLLPFLMLISHITGGGSIFGLPWWGPPFAHCCRKLTSD